jgi:hypothetical protein
VTGVTPPGSGLRPFGTEPQAPQAEPLVPNAGAVFRIPYPFVRDTYSGFDGVDGFADMPTWKPGVRYEPVGPEDAGAVADALGQAIFTVEAVFKPGRFPTRVFFTRQFVNPDGKQFGKSKLHIATLEKFRRLSRGYQHPFGIGEPLEARWGWRDVERIFKEMLAEHRDAQAIEARQGGDAKQGSTRSAKARSEGCAQNTSDTQGGE